MACVNNFVWIDTQTGLLPAGTALSPQHVCIPCSSDFVRWPLQVPTTPLFSVWSFQGGLAPVIAPGHQGTPIQAMQGKAGACYACPPNTDTIATSDVMCQSPPGFGKPVGTPTLVSIQMGGVLTVGQTPIARVLSLRTPIIKPSSQDFFLCCGRDLQCRLFQKAEMDRNQAHFGPDSFYMQCTNNATGAIYGGGKRLLSADGEVQACYASQYNGERGNDVCNECPQGALLLWGFCHMASECVHRSVHAVPLPGSNVPEPLPMPAWLLRRAHQPAARVQAVRAQFPPKRLHEREQLRAVPSRCRSRVFLLG